MGGGTAFLLFNIGPEERLDTGEGRDSYCKPVLQVSMA